MTIRSPAQQLFQLFYSTQDKGSSSLICLAVWEPQSQAQNRGLTHRAASSTLSILLHGIKNSQSLPNTECQRCPKPRYLPWPYPLTEKPTKPCCRQMGLLNDFTALLSDNCFLCLFHVFQSSLLLQGAVLQDSYEST